MTQPYTDADVWRKWERQNGYGLNKTDTPFYDCTQTSRAQFDKALHQTQVEPPAYGLRNLAAWLVVLAVAGAIGAAIVARRGR